jgi:hypothetical protein
MTNYVGINETRYSSEDLNALFKAFLENTRTQEPEDLGGSTLLGYSWSLGDASLPIQLRGWTDWEEREVTAGRWLNRSGRSGYSAGEYSGPWFVREPTKKRYGWRQHEQSTEYLHILTAKNVFHRFPPLEALALSNEDVLPKDVLVQIIWWCIPRFGLKLLSKNQRLASSTVSDEVAGMVVARAFVAAYSGSVRVLKRVEDPVDKRKLSPEDSMRRLLDTYGSGVAARNMKWKLWAAKENLEKMYRLWNKTEKHLERVEKKGGTVFSHPPVSAVLRELAAEFEHREQERKKHG